MRIRALVLALLALGLAVTEAEAEPAEGHLRLNEVLYDPVPGAGEWIELYNAGPDLNLQGTTLTDQDGHTYAFPSLAVPRGAYLVLKVGPGPDTGFRNHAATLHMGLSVPILNDDGDDLLLLGRGRVLDYLRYGEGPAADPPPPQAPWAGSADLVPEGLSLSLLPNGHETAQASDWKGAPPSPGRSNDLPLHQGLVLTELLPHAPRDDEFVVVTNQGPSVVDLGAWSLSDGEGSWVLPPSLLFPGAAILVAQNATALDEDGGLVADLCLRGCDNKVRVHGSLALRDGGDEVWLVDPIGRVVDAYRYGEATGETGWAGKSAPALPRGHVARRHSAEGRLLDTNTSADWVWDRPFRLGQSRRPPVSFEGVGVRPLLSPEGSLETLLLLLRHARSEILLAGFTLTNAVVAEALQEAAARGVTIQVGLEENPPGGVPPDGKRFMDELAEAGIRVLRMGTHGEGAWRRYTLHHAKYVIVDGTWLLLGSENFSPNGYPERVGNRGWGVLVYSRDLARWFLDVVREDWDENRSDIRTRPGRPLHKGGSETGSSFAPPLVPADVMALLGPDNAVGHQGLLGVLGRAARSIDVELFYLHWDWRGASNPLLGAVIQAAARGVAVRVLLDGQPYNVEGAEDNDEAAARLNRLAREHGLPLEARVFPGRVGDVVKIHNKGLIVDGERVWISSLNWNYPGAYENREAGLVVESREVARFFQRAWDGDWAASEAPPGGPLQERARLELAPLVALGSGVAAAVWWWKLRTTKEPTNKRRRKAEGWRPTSRRPSSESPRRNSKSTRIVR